MKEEIIKRLKSPVVWLSVIAQIAVIIAHYSPSISTTFEEIATPILEILITFGILNNPTDRGNF